MAPGNRSRHPRSGVTLTEVLISVMVMGIGVVTLASMFPVSLLRTIEATQRTKATLLRMNAEAMVSLVPQLVDNARVPPPRANDDAVTLRVVDPLGFFLMPAAFRPRFGNDGSNPIGPLRVNPTGIAAVDTQAEAEALVTLPDSWIEQFKDAPLSFGATSVVLRSTFDGSSVPTDKGQSRVVLTDTVARRSVVRALSPPTASPPGVQGTTLNWVQPLPTGFTPDLVRVQTRERRYTWFLTVRKKADGTSRVDVVVVFRRSFTPEDERIYQRNGGADLVFTAGSDVAVVNGYTSADKPTILKGGYVFDATREDANNNGVLDPNEDINGNGVLDANGFWYRIEDVIDQSNTSATLRLSRPAVADGNAAILMRGVVEVFPIGNR